MILPSLQPHALVLALVIALTPGATLAADRVYSGPQPGEKTTPFTVLEPASSGEVRERVPITEHAGAPTAIVFIHGVERSLVPLLRVIDQYGAERKDRLKTELVFLFPDRLAGEQRLKAVNGSLKLQGRVSLSPEGTEGPGNYGLNKECLMTILAAKDNRVMANFALVQPGIVDAPKIIEALARVCGDTNAPTVAQLTERGESRGGAGRERGGKMAADGAKPRTSDQTREKFPGAVPTDPKLNSLLRQFIRPTNDVITVDLKLKEVEAHIQGHADLTQQAIDGWTRVLHFGDRYGTEYSRKVGSEFLARLKRQPAPTAP